MSEKLTEVYDKYDIEVLGSRRGRGATILSTPTGLYILEPFRSSESRLEQEHVLKGLLEREGFCEVDSIIPNKHGELITYDRYHQPFVLKKHFDGAECDMRNIAEVVRAIEKLAEFHICGQKVSQCFPLEWERTKQQKAKQQLNEMKQALAEGEEIEQVARIYGMSPAALREIVKESEQTTQKSMPEENVISSDEGVQGGKTRSQEDRAKEDERTSKKDTQDGECTVLDTFIRHNRELRKIRKFVGGVKRKNSFENLFLKVFPEYYNKGLQCEEIFGKVLQAENSNHAKVVANRHYGICHGNYNQHNVIMGDDATAIVHFERFSRGNQLEDLYQFARKVMEKNHFDYEILELLLSTYAKQIDISKEDYRYLYVLLSYPEKFWKIANSYYNTNKAFLSPKYVEKLLTVIEQEKEKNELLSQYYSFHLQ